MKTTDEAVAALKAWSIELKNRRDQLVDHIIPLIDRDDDAGKRRKRLLEKLLNNTDDAVRHADAVIRALSA